MDGKKKRPTDPERRARWAETRREFEAWFERLEQDLERTRLERERRRARLRRLTFGVFGRS